MKICLFLSNMEDTFSMVGKSPGFSAPFFFLRFLMVVFLPPPPTILLSFQNPPRSLSFGAWARMTSEREKISSLFPQGILGEREGGRERGRGTPGEKSLHLSLSLSFRTWRSLSFLTLSLRSPSPYSCFIWSTSTRTQRSVLYMYNLESCLKKKLCCGTFSWRALPGGSLSLEASRST